MFRALRSEFIREHNIFRLINGVVRFDRKLTATLPTRVRVRSPGALFWSAILVAYFVFYVALHRCVMSSDASTIVEDRSVVVGRATGILFASPRVMDFTITVTACFYLCNLGHRFCALTTAWRNLLSVGGPGDKDDAGLFATRRAAETAKLADDVRLLHAELSDLLGKFNAACGPTVFSSFVFLAYDAVRDLYCATIAPEFTIGYVSCLQQLHNLCAVLCLAYVASWTNNKV